LNKQLTARKLTPKKEMPGLLTRHHSYPKAAGFLDLII
jgi:hypothetical protein